MELDELLGVLLSQNSLNGISKTTHTSDNAVKSVLASALPDLLGGAVEQTKDTSILDGFTTALSDHSSANTSDLASFFSGVDMEDGTKIVNHLLGNNKKTATAKAAKKAGVSDNDAASIISAAAPLLMSLLGQQAKSKKASKSSDVAEVIGSLLGNANVSDALTTLLGGKTTNSKSKKKNSDNLLSSLFKMLK